MMFFKKKKRYTDYIIDLGKLRSKGIIKESDETPVSDDSSSPSPEGLGFLGSLASAAETSSSDSSSDYGSYSSSSSDLPADLRDKIRNISDKLYKILDRIDLLEHKIDRIERRIGVREDI